MNEILYWLNTTYACGGIICEDGLVIEAAPIYQWMTGKRFAACLQYLRAKSSCAGASTRKRDAGKQDAIKAGPNIYSNIMQLL